MGTLCSCHCARNQCSISGCAFSMRFSRSSSGPIKAVVRWGTIKYLQKVAAHILADRKQCHIPVLLANEMSKCLTVMLGHCFNLATLDAQPHHGSVARLLWL